MHFGAVSMFFLQKGSRTPKSKHYNMQTLISFIENLLPVKRRMYSINKYTSFIKLLHIGKIKKQGLSSLEKILEWLHIIISKLSYNSD